jgi:ankyrin repeat protein
MKYTLAAILAAISLNAAAQQASENPLLEQGFWRGKPGVEQVKAEISKGADPAQLNASAFDPVVLAINSGAPNESVFYLLEQKGNGPAKITHDGRTYIFWAAGKGNVEVMKYLIAHGAKTAISDDHGIYVASFAAVLGQQNQDVYELCVKSGTNLKAEKNHDGANALLVGIGLDTAYALTKYFESKGLSVHDKDEIGHTSFDYAARAGNLKVMKLLREKGIKYSNDVMLLAAQGTRRASNTLDVYQYLESIGAKPAATGKTGENALHYIARKPEQAPIIRYFLDRGVNPDQLNEDGNTVFMAAAGSNRDTATLAMLLAGAKDINQKNKSGESALSLAVRGNSSEVIRFLLNHGADIRNTDAKGNNLGFYLFESYNRRQLKEFVPKLELLSSSGLDLNSPQADGNTIYHMAVAKNDVELLKAIEPYKSGVNAKNREGLTALHRAAMMSKDDAVLKYLLSIGADRSLKTEMNETAFDLAKDNEAFAKQHTDIEFLK